ncbi:NTP transferase domain-containing protein [Sphingomonas sp. KR1UV-12]|uniref:NTP transferase domain-containing protein n=1 Tax=Sphingomonas aurea TaxID=3063994 RepID=A0ABT9EN31_9SPHN|nr:NTP transferase domain-containing protein [Sphingomonas sp. KR1UV-12]MDP1028367.1 NTP transferase domain-containing protein [Sphingomonas sp. KR1UV-12]
MIRSAVLLAAGHGSRLRASAPYKPLCPVAGRPLIDHALCGMAEAGLTRAIVVLGYGAEAIADHLARRRWPLAVETVMTRDHHEPNGVSVLAAAPLLAGEPAVLAMCDHLVAPALYTRLACTGAGDGATLGIDRRVGHPWVDPDDVTWVRTEDDLIVDIGKGLAGADCYDTGVFAIGPALFAALGSFGAPSLTDGMRLLAGEARARVVDCSDLDWIDVDDPAALAKAEAWQLARAA